jgi:hypothetical protein
VTSAISLDKFFVLWCLLLKWQGVFDVWLTEWFSLPPVDALVKIDIVMVFKAVSA